MVRSTLTLFLIIGIVGACSLPVMAQEKRVTFEELESKLLTIKNPFQSQLPKPKVEPKVTQKEKQKTPQPKPVAKKPKPTPSVQKPTIPRPTIISKPKEEMAVPNITISGIIWNSDRPQAIINGEIIEVGDKVLEIEITNIQKTGVDGIFHGRPVTIEKQRSQL